MKRVVRLSVIMLLVMLMSAMTAFAVPAGYKEVKLTKKNFKKYFKISKRYGTVTVKKGLKKGTYKIKVKIKAGGNTNYKQSAVKTVTFKIRVK